jgi:hypothetical protein
VKPAKPTAPKRMSPNEYAAHRGVTRGAVRAAIARGRLSAASAEFDGRVWRIDPVAADAEWDRNTKQARGRGRSGESAGTNELVLSNAKVASVVGLEVLPRDENGEPLPPMMVAAIKTAVETEIKRLELAKLSGSLVPADEAARVLSNAGRTVRDAILSVPARLAHQLGSERDPAKVEILLERALTDALLAICPEP